MDSTMATGTGAVVENKACESCFTVQDLRGRLRTKPMQIWFCIRFREQLTPNLPCLSAYQLRKTQNMELLRTRIDNLLQSLQEKVNDKDSVLSDIATQLETQFPRKNGERTTTSTATGSASKMSACVNEIADIQMMTRFSKRCPDNVIVPERKDLRQWVVREADLSRHVDALHEKMEPRQYPLFKVQKAFGRDRGLHDLDEKKHIMDAQIFEAQGKSDEALRLVTRFIESLKHLGVDTEIDEIDIETRSTRVSAALDDFVEELQCMDNAERAAWINKAQTEAQKLCVQVDLLRAQMQHETQDIMQQQELTALYKEEQELLSQYEPVKTVLESFYAKSLDDFEASLHPVPRRDLLEQIVHSLLKEREQLVESKQAHDKKIAEIGELVRLGQQTCEQVQQAKTALMRAVKEREWKAVQEDIESALANGAQDTRETKKQSLMDNAYARVGQWVVENVRPIEHDLKVVDGKLYLLLDFLAALNIFGGCSSADFRSSVDDDVPPADLVVPLPRTRQQKARFEFEAQLSRLEATGLAVDYQQAWKEWFGRAEYCLAAESRLNCSSLLVILIRLQQLLDHLRHDVDDDEEEPAMEAQPALDSDLSEDEEKDSGLSADDVFSQMTVSERELSEAQARQREQEREKERERLADEAPREFTNRLRQAIVDHLQQLQEAETRLQVIRAATVTQLREQVAALDKDFDRALQQKTDDEYETSRWLCNVLSKCKQQEILQRWSALIKNDDDDKKTSKIFRVLEALRSRNPRQSRLGKQRRKKPASLYPFMLDHPKRRSARNCSPWLRYYLDAQKEERQAVKWSLSLLNAEQLVERIACWDATACPDDLLEITLGELRGIANDLFPLSEMDECRANYRQHRDMSLTAPAHVKSGRKRKRKEKASENHSTAHSESSAKRARGVAPPRDPRATNHLVRLAQ